jgi:hypothetical protein
VRVAVAVVAVGRAVLAVALKPALKHNALLAERV